MIITVSKTINETAFDKESTNFEGIQVELSRQRLREKTLKRFNYVRTCVLARELCLLIRTNRVSFNPEDVRECCDFVSNLCREAGCIEQSKLCLQAVNTVCKDEEKYLELCKQSCLKCGEARQPIPKKKTTYVA